MGRKQKIIPHIPGSFDDIVKAVVSPVKPVKKIRKQRKDDTSDIQENIRGFQTGVPKK